LNALYNPISRIVCILQNVQSNQESVILLILLNLYLTDKYKRKYMFSLTNQVLISMAATHSTKVGTEACLPLDNHLLITLFNHFGIEDTNC